MANRSHVYVTDAIPTAEAPGKPRGICEFNWGIPVSHQLLVGNAPRLCPSAIWSQHTIGIVSESDGAVDRLLAFARKVGEGKLKDAEAFQKDLANMEAFFAAGKGQGKYFLMEAGEIFDAEGDLAGGAKKQVDVEIPDTVKKVDAALSAKKPTKFLQEIRADWQGLLGISWFSEVLYYSF